MASVVLVQCSPTFHSWLSCVYIAAMINHVFKIFSTVQIILCDILYIHFYNPYKKIFALAHDYSIYITWLNIPQLKLGNIPEYSLILKTMCVAKKIWMVINRIASIWQENMPTTDICSRSVPQSSQVSQATFSENYLLLGTGNVHGQISWNSFAWNRGYCLCILQVYYKLRMWPAPRWLESSVGSKLYQYCRGHGFESHSGLKFFRALISQLLKLCDCITCSSSIWYFKCSIVWIMSAN